MKAVATLSLVWLLVSSGGALQCDKGTPECKCAKVTGNAGKTESTHCLTDTVCKSASKGFSIQHQKNISISVKCCGTDCKGTAAPDLKPNMTANKLICFSCKGKSCEHSKCVGDQDQCWSHNVAGNGVIGGGCMSSNTCGLMTQTAGLAFLKDVVKVGIEAGPKCCKGNLCNSAKSVKLSVVLSVFWLAVGLFVVS